MLGCRGGEQPRELDVVLARHLAATDPLGEVMAAVTRLGGRDVAAGDSPARRPRDRAAAGAVYQLLEGGVLGHLASGLKARVDVDTVEFDELGLRCLGHLI